MPGIARANRDRAGGIIRTGAATVFVNNLPAALDGSVIGTAPNPGDIIVHSLVQTVFVENKKIAVLGSVTARGRAVSSASENVSAG